MTAPAFPIERVREQFPALAILDGGVARVYADNPAGTQVPEQVPRAIAAALLECNGNLGGFFVTSRLAEQIVVSAHEAMAAFVNARSYREILVAQSMTNATLHLSRSIGRTLKRGDEIVVTRMDHDGNIAPWLMLAEDLGLTVRWLDFSRESWTIEKTALERILSSRTRLLALNYASNLTGSINDVAALTRLAKSAGALVYVDAVQYAPHRLIDVQALNCDFLACSSYKFFGPHLGILWGREELLGELTPYKPRPQSGELPWRFETGTPQIEMLAGLEACIGYLAALGEMTGAAGSLRSQLVGAFSAMHAWEDQLTQRFLAELHGLPEFAVRGITDPAALENRVPTISFTSARRSAAEIARQLAASNIFVWSGNNFALEVVRALGLDEDDGVLRVGFAHYNTPQEVDAVAMALRA